MWFLIQPSLIYSLAGYAWKTYLHMWCFSFSKFRSFIEMTKQFVAHSQKLGICVNPKTRWNCKKLWIFRNKSVLKNRWKHRRVFQFFWLTHSWSSTSHSRRKPGWRFTAGVQYDLELKLLEELANIWNFNFRKYELLKILYGCVKCWVQIIFEGSKNDKKIEKFEIFSKIVWIFNENWRNFREKI